MKIITSILSVFTFSLVLFSCGNKSADTVNPLEKITVQQEKHSDEHQAEVLELNGSEKWKVNDEMKPYLSKSEAILKDYTASNVSDHEELAQQLKEEIQGLIKSCTMDGKSHEELHKWLHPYQEKVNQLGKSENKETANLLVSELQISFQTYHQYFQ